MIPSGYKEDVVYSQIPTSGAGDLSFTRASNGTRINSAGLVEVTPWNLASYSEDFTNAVWTVSNATITSNSIVAPNGTTTADTISGTTIGSEPRARQTTAQIGSSVYSLSCYAKKGTVDWVILRNIAVNNSGGSRAWFNLNTGVVGTTNSGISATIESVGNGWYRCTIYGTTDASPTNLIDIAPAPADNDFTTNASGENIYIWGAQLNIGSTAKPYFPTTDRLNVPRLTYQNGGGGCPSLLLEKQSTNLVTYSEQFDDLYWSKAGVSVTANNTTSPDGTTNADKLTSSGAGNDEYIQRPGLTTTAGTYTSSIFVKNVNASITVLMAVHLGEGSQTSDMRYNWSTNTITTAGTNVVSAKATNYGNGWVRLEFTYTIGALVTGHWYRVYVQTGTSTNSIYIYGAQLEASSYPTSYIPTTSSSATRVADACFKTGISSLIGQTEGVLFLDFQKTNNDNTGLGGYFRIDVNDGTTANRILLGFDSNNLSASVIASSTIQCSITTTGTQTEKRIKIAFAYKANDFVLYVNGVQIGADTSGSIPANMANFQWGVNQTTPTQTSGIINEQIFFPTRLSNSELASLTTI